MWPWRSVCLALHAPSACRQQETLPWCPCLRLPQPPSRGQQWHVSPGAATEPKHKGGWPAACLGRGAWPAVQGQTPCRLTKQPCVWPALCKPHRPGWLRTGGRVAAWALGRCPWHPGTVPGGWLHTVSVTEGQDGEFCLRCSTRSGVQSHWQGQAGSPSWARACCHRRLAILGVSQDMASSVGLLGQPLPLLPLPQSACMAASVPARGPVAANTNPVFSLLSTPHHVWLHTARWAPSGSPQGTF